MDSLKILIPALTAVIAWYLNERRKRAWEEYERKEKNYSELIKALKGFYASHADADRKKLKNQFIDQLNLCWLYSPDDVILAGYAFLETVHADQKRSDEEKQQSLGAFILAIRNDLLKRKITKTTSLTKGNFRLLSST